MKIMGHFHQYYSNDKSFIDISYEVYLQFFYYKLIFIYNYFAIFLFILLN